MPHNTIGIPLNTKVAWVRDAFDVFAHVLQQDGLPVRHVTDVFEVSRDCVASTLAGVLTLVTRAARRFVAFTADSMDVVDGEEILVCKGGCKSAEDLINNIVCVPHRKKADLDDFEATVMHQQMSNCQNIFVLVFTPAIVDVEVECRRQFSLMGNGIVT